MPGNVRDFFSLGWEEMKFKTRATLSRQGLNSRILMLLKTPRLRRTSGRVYAPDYSKGEEENSHF